MQSGMPKPTSRFGQADANGIFPWDGGFFWWPDTRLLVTRRRRDWTPENSAYTCPMKVIMHANYVLAAVEQCFFDDEETFYREGAWPRRFDNIKNRYGPLEGVRTLTRLDFRLLLLG